jgi:hypothetical protein
MAKVGEGDPRWLVENRPDGRNVLGWHWYFAALVEDYRSYFYIFPFSFLFLLDNDIIHFEPSEGRKKI